ncbi:MAG: hypothetical protein HZA62_04430 [Rhodocyclales bacterium]|nr:hypothetical protein [Rhodocyclales bacterium]
MTSRTHPMRRLLPVVFGIVFLAGCASTAPTSAIHASVVAESVLDCFPAGALEADGTPYFCEASATVIAGDRVLVASDKTLPQGTPLISIRRDGFRLLSNDVKPIMAQLPRAARKFEGMTRSADGQHVFATTAFDRYDPKSPRFDAYNMLLAWPADRPEQAQLIASQTRDGTPSSLPLRRVLEGHLGMPYFKIEGLMALPGNRLVFGVREAGRNFSDFSYRIQLIEVNYDVDALGNISLRPGMRTLMDFKPDTLHELPAGIGLSSVEYEATRNRVYFTTSHETGNKLGAYLWQISLDDLDRGRPPTIVRDAKGIPLHFDNKAEGLAIIDAGHLLIIHDDDRVTGGKHDRRPHQAVYSVVEISE